MGLTLCCGAYTGGLTLYAQFVTQKLAIVVFAHKAKCQGSSAGFSFWLLTCLWLTAVASSKYSVGQSES